MKRRQWLRLLLTVLIVIFSISFVVQMYIYSVGNYIKSKPMKYARRLQRNTPTRGVLIVTNYRSGSSFVGELFNQHPNVFYTYEPLVPVDLQNMTSIVDTLRSTLSCNFRNLIEDNSEIDKLKWTGQKCVMNNICFRTRTKELCSERFCAAPISCAKCRRVETHELNSICESKAISATKVIRLRSLSILETLMQDKKMDLKILHLIRDPRGIASSRKKLNNYNDMVGTCARMYNNVNLSLIKQPEWLKGRYKLIRYEDVAINPIKMVEKIYDFVGLDMTDSIRKWIHINTQGEIAISKDARLKKMFMRRRKLIRIKYQQFKQLVLSDAYTTIRYSNATWQSWRKELNNSDTDAIQTQCKDVMKLFGYNLLHPETKQLVDFRILNPLASFDERTLTV
uniref:carbohydrate sulfotransferase 1-like n=1 Tax=Styela clava TaxID=7725 RepID=UPI0019399754|nr:carbohydrate sulfotransferase 1-like [Styela clava]